MTGAGLVDIHAHPLPGIDDGPADLDGSVEMARAAVEAGTRTLAATPHLRSDFPGVRVGELGERCARLREALEREGVELELVCAAEVSLVWALEAGKEELVLASYGQRGQDLLIETPTSAIGLPGLLYQVRAQGFRVTLAHPERTAEFARAPEHLLDLADQGVLLQVNADSLLSTKRGSPVRAVAEQLCRAGVVHALASDGHRGSAWRPVTTLPAGIEAAAALVGRERAIWMARDAPAAIIAGERLPPAPPIAAPRRNGLLGRLVGRSAPRPRP